MQNCIVLLPPFALPHIEISKSCGRPCSPAEVVAEAIAMRKRVVLPTSPCNVFFQENFPDRCHFYNSLDVTSFVKALRAALDGGMPEPLTESEQELAQL